MMIRRIVLAAALAAAWSAPAHAADPPVEIVDFGTYHAKATGYVKTPDNIAGVEGRATGIALERQTETVLGQIGRFFGLRYRVNDPALVGKVLREYVPFNRVLGIEIESHDPHSPRLRFDMRPELIGNARRGILHGGVISAVLDVAAGFAIMLALAKDAQPGEKPEFPNIGTIDLRVDYLRPGRGRHFIASSRVVRMGNRIAVAHMELVNDAGELIATGGAAYVVG